MTTLDNYQYYKDLYEERAGILEFDSCHKDGSKLTRKEAETIALQQIKMQYMDDNNLNFNTKGSQTMQWLGKLEKELRNNE